MQRYKIFRIFANFRNKIFRLCYLFIVICLFFNISMSVSAIFSVPQQHYDFLPFYRVEHNFKIPLLFTPMYTDIFIQVVPAKYQRRVRHVQRFYPIRYNT